MEAAVITAPHKAAVQQWSAPEAGPGEVLIKVQSAGLCGTDLQVYSGEYMTRYPIVPGHEFAGTVVQLGPGVTRLAVGDRVAADPNVACNRCYFCQRNEQNHCEHWQGIGITRDGAFAPYVSAPVANVFDIGDLAFDVAAMVEPLACVVYGLERARVNLGAEVLIVGAGPIGLLHLQTVRMDGAASIVVTDVKRDRLKLVEELGGIPVHAGPEQAAALGRIASRGFDLVIDATGVPSVIEESVRYVKRGGKLLVFGVCPPDAFIRINPFEMFQKDLTILGSFAVKKTFPEAISLLQSGFIDTERLISDRLPISEFARTIERFERGETHMKILFRPN